MIEFIRSNSAIIAAASVAMFMGSLVVTWVIIVRMPSDYFCHDSEPAEIAVRRFPLWQMFIRVVKNIVGVIFVAFGFIMLFTPGQGVLLLLLGAMAIDFPGKQRVIRSLLNRSNVRNGINKIRRRSGQPPLRLPWIEERSKTETTEPNEDDR